MATGSGRQHQPGWLSFARFLGFGGFLGVIAGALWWGGRYCRERRYRLYAGLVVLLAIPILFNDLIRVQTHVTPYPMLWIMGAVALAMLWWEFCLEVERVQDALDTDPLTLAASRRFGEAYGATCLAVGSLGVLYGDIDGFKAINDRYGHAAGDQVLREVVSRLRAGLRARDRVVRLGGDEFLVLVPGSSDDSLERIRARLFRDVSGRPVVLTAAEARLPIPVRISLGSAWADANVEFAALVELADQAMYREKREHEDEAPEGDSGAFAGGGPDPVRHPSR